MTKIDVCLVASRSTSVPPGYDAGYATETLDFGRFKHDIWSLVPVESKRIIVYVRKELDVDTFF